MRRNSEINSEIYNFGAVFFEAVKTEIIANGTAAPTSTERETNQRLLIAAVTEVMNQSVFRTELNNDEFWQVLWPRIVYAETLASKATAEISSMRSLVPLFQSLSNFAKSNYVFDKNEWAQFVARWKNRYAGNHWLRLAKKDPDWNPQTEFVNTTPDVWKLLIKDDESYPNLKFSALDHKVEKYINIAHLLDQRRITGNDLALHHYTGGYIFNPEHLTGQAWLEERRVLSSILNKLEKEVGKLTAMHTIMDLGLKVIKPDRVMTFLFSQLGWLITLPNTLSKSDVIRAYEHDDVIEEMTIRADVLANRLALAGYDQAHRLLDIWLVKYGQEPELSWGITVNLQKVRNIRQILDEVMMSSKPDIYIDSRTANEMWPWSEFTPIQISRKGNYDHSELSEDNKNASVSLTSRKRKRLAQLD